MSQFPSTFLERLRERSPTTPASLTSGLNKPEAQRRLARARANLLKPARRTDTLPLSLAQFKSPIIIILLFAAGVSFFLHDPADGGSMVVDA